MAYVRSVVTFVDILGFTDLVSRRSAQDVDEMLEAIGVTAGRPGGPDGGLTQTLSFSDSVVRARPLETSSVYDGLLHEILDLATAQWTLLEYGLLIRGGMTVGEVSIAGGRVFGPAFGRAYRLESSLAGSPRIVIDPAVIAAIRAHLRSVATRAEKGALINDLRSHIRLGDDGVWFIDYLNSISLMSEADYVRSTLASVRQFVIEQVRALDEDSLVIPKYLWLIRYHNQSVRRLFPNVPGLKIRAIDVPASDELLRPRRNVP